MKSAAFAYRAPRSIEESVALLHEHGTEGKVLAGGQSLVPAMNFRLARPALLIDVNHVAGLDTITVEPDIIRIGALSRHVRFENRLEDGPVGALLPDVARHIAHTPIRMRGTFGGSLAHADPASEWCSVALALDAEMVATRHTGTRVIAADDFFTTLFTTALQPDELLTEIRLPRRDASWRCGFSEFSRRAGDFALALAVVALQVESGTIRQARIALGSVAATPVLAASAAKVLVGAVPSVAVIRLAAEAATADCDPPDDIHGTSDYRRDLVGAMVRRALTQALLS